MIARWENFQQYFNKMLAMPLPSKFPDMPEKVYTPSEEELGVLEKQLNTLHPNQPHRVKIDVTRYVSKKCFQNLQKYINQEFIPPMRVDCYMQDSVLEIPNFRKTWGQYDELIKLSEERFVAKWKKVQEYINETLIPALEPHRTDVVPNSQPSP